MNKRLEPGTWFAGFSAPFFVSDSMIRGELEKKGLRNVEIFDREDKAPPVNPRIDPDYSDDWDQWVQATYSGESKVVELPDQIAWLLVKRPKVPSSSTPTAPSSSTPSSSTPSSSTPTKARHRVAAAVIVLTLAALSAVKFAGVR